MSHSLPYEVNCSILFTELPLLERPAAAKAAGFDAVEFWWPFAVAEPSDADVDAFVTAIQDAGVSLVGLNFFAGDMPGGDRGLVSWPARSAEFRANIPVVASIGERLGCKAFNALYGNRVDDASAAELDELGAENLALACVSCSLRKAARQTAIDPQTREEVPVYHPRRERWSVHFRWEGVRVIGQTATGRATVAALDMNRPLMLAIRQEEANLGRHPPPSPARVV